MKTYNDLSDYEKAQLTDDEFERYLNIARMQSEIIVDDPEPDIADVLDGMELVTVWEVRSSHWNTLATFATREEAESLLSARPLSIERDYEIGIPFLKGEPGRLEVVSTTVATYDSYQKNKPDVERRKTMAKDRDVQIKRRADLIEEREKELIPMREDRERCQYINYRVGQIKTKLSEFLGLCDGDETIARKFLARHYTDQDIAISDAWPR
jgi:hypothetical protein